MCIDPRKRYWIRCENDIVGSHGDGLIVCIHSAYLDANRAAREDLGAGGFEDKIDGWTLRRSIPNEEAVSDGPFAPV
jgi:hypothetical protein